MDNQSNTPATEAEENIPMTNMDQMAFGIAQWFDTNQSQLEQAFNVPDGQTVTIKLTEDGPEEELVLTGDVLKGFRAGIVIAQSVFDKLPFDVTVELAPEAANDEPTSPQ